MSVNLFTKTWLAVCLLLCEVPGIFAQADRACIISKNYISATDTSKYIETRVYDNGLGDVAEEIQVGVTPDKKDLVVLHEYDEFRRKTNVWLPTVSSDNGNYVKPSVLMKNSLSQYGDSKPYAHTVYWESLCNQGNTQFRPGEEWQNADKSVKTEIQPDFINRCRSIPGVYSLIYLDTYGSLCQKKRITDEDGNKHEEYYDAITGRKLADKDESGLTHYLYDILDNLSAVVPPALTDYLDERRSKDSYVYTSDEMIKKYGYIYEYNFHRQCISKELPGCEPVYYIYDRAGRCIFSQDGNQREKGIWYFNIPDKFGRTCISGTCRNTFDYKKEPFKDVLVYVDKPVKGGDNFGYTTINGVSLQDMEIYEALYYDDDSCCEDIKSDFFRNFVYRLHLPLSLFSFKSFRGLLVAKRSAYFDRSGIRGYKNTIYSYDENRRVNHIINITGNGIYVTSTEYTLSGKPLNMHVYTLGNIALELRFIRENLTYNYDHAERLISVTHQINDGKTVKLKEYGYDELGRVLKEFSGGDVNLETTYAYNIQNSLNYKCTKGYYYEQLFYQGNNGCGNEPLYNGNISSKMCVYEKPEGWTEGDDVGSNHIFGYNYKYDATNRLTSAEYWNEDNRDENYTASYAYDCMGNVTSLYRYGLDDKNNYSATNSLRFAYNGNQLVSVSDKVASPTYNGFFGFRDGASDGNEYTYDANGNMTSDKNKGIVNIEYNILNLPAQVVFADGHAIDFTYDSDGNKLRTAYSTNVLSILYGGRFYDVSSLSAYYDRTDYIGNLIFKNGKFDMLITEGGYVKQNEGGTYSYNTYIKDYQGNNVMEVGKVQADGKSVAKVLQANMYYPYGGSFSCNIESTGNRFKYNGKELDRTHGLDWYDYGARNYDAALCRWHNIDPLCEKYYNISPYAYCANNPILFVDPDGRSFGDYLTSNGEFIASDGIDDDKLYVLKTTKTNFDSYGGAKSAGIKTETAKAVIKNKDISNPDNFVLVDGTQETRQNMVDGIKDNGEGGTSDANNREYSVTYQREDKNPIVYSKAGPVGDPAKDSQISVEQGDSPEIVYGHSHPSGTNEGARWYQAPSKVDVGNAGTQIRYVFGMGDKTVYMYNSEGIKATLPLNVYKNYKVGKH